MLVTCGAEVPFDDDMKKLIHSFQPSSASAFLLIVALGMLILSFTPIRNHLSQNNYDFSFLILVLIGICTTGPLKDNQKKLSKFLNDTAYHLQKNLRSNQGALTQADGLLMKLEREKRDLHGRSIEIEKTKQHRDYLKSKKSIEELEAKVRSAKKAFSGELKILSKHIP
jgi:uncharacterized protein YoxC